MYSKLKTSNFTPVKYCQMNCTHYNKKVFPHQHQCLGDSLHFLQFICVKISRKSQLVFCPSLGFQEVSLFVLVCFQAPVFVYSLNSLSLFCIKGWLFWSYVVKHRFFCMRVKNHTFVWKCKFSMQIYSSCHTNQQKELHYSSERLISEKVSRQCVRDVIRSRTNQIVRFESADSKTKKKL